MTMIKMEMSTGQTQI